MEKKIRWSPKSQDDLNQILSYWIQRNKSELYSLKLINAFNEATMLIVANPLIGKVSEVKGVRMKLVRDHWLFYEETETEIIILQITSTFQNPELFFKDI